MSRSTKSAVWKRLSSLLSILAACLLAGQAAASGSEFVASLATDRADFSSTLLPSGKVIVVGGDNENGTLASTEIFDPATSRWASAAPLPSARQQHTATLLLSGKLLVVGGLDGTSNHNQYLDAALYDPATDTWSSGGTPTTTHYLHTATLLQSGKVLVVGGDTGAADLYDPQTNTWSPAGSLTHGRYVAAATLLPSGQVLVAGGIDDDPASGIAIASAELYDPGTNSWSTTGSLATARTQPDAVVLPSGTVLVSGGLDGANAVLSSCEIYDPAIGMWSATGSMLEARAVHSASVLPSGKVLAAGGVTTGFSPLLTTELFDPQSGTWSPADPLAGARFGHAATLLPTGRLLLVDGDYPGKTVELYDPTTSTAGTAHAITTARARQTATLLPTGKVLVAGGQGGGLTAELYDPASDTWGAAGSLASSHTWGTATLLATGKVLLAGGGTTAAELYDPTNNTWSSTGNLALAHSLSSATLLSSGKVLVAGGFDSEDTPSAAAELYDPAAGTWTAAASMPTAVAGHRAVLLPSGKVLVTGGENADSLNSVASSELYDPVSNTWSFAAPMTTAREAHTLTLLPSGKVLAVAGVDDASNYGASAEIYDPLANSWSSAGALTVERNNATATLLPSGLVLIAGGINNAGAIADTEFYDPAVNAWTPGPTLGTARLRFTSTLLPSGAVLVVAGNDSSINNHSSVELIDPGLSPTDPVIAPASRRPTLSAVSAMLFQNGQLGATGSGFLPPLEASGGGRSNNSATNMPVFELQRLDNEQTRFIANDETVNFSDGNFTAAAASLAGFPPGPILVRVWVNGIPSATLPSLLLSSGFVSLDSTRILDTRPGQLTVDHEFEGQGALGAHGELDLDVLGRGGVAANGVDAVVLNVTVADSSATGFVTVWPKGATRPTASNLNFTPGDSISNLVIVKLGTDGQVALFNSAGSTDLIADVVGYFTVGSDLTSFAPVRLLDTRVGRTTADNLYQGQGPLAAHGQLDLLVAGRDGNIVPAVGAGAVIFNVTAADTTQTGFVTVWPTGATRPTASTLNFVAGQTIPNLAVMQLGSGGDISLFNSQGNTDLIVDVSGWLPLTSDLTTLVPARLLDTRVGRTTVDGQDQGGGALPAKTEFDLQVSGRGGIPVLATGAAILNVTVTSPTASGFLVAWPNGSTRPHTSNINFFSGQTVANLVVARIGADGKVSLYANAKTDLVVDVVGYFSGGP